MEERHIHPPVRRACIISLTNVVQEPRVLRQIRTLQERGWLVSVIGHSHGAPVPADWDFLDAALEPAHQSETRRIRHLLVSDPPAAARRIGEIVYNHARPHWVRVAHAAIEMLRRDATPHWSTAKARRLSTRVPGMAALIEKVLRETPHCDLVIAHDYFTYCLADALARRDGSRLALDCHEYAMEQYDHGSHPDREVRFQWRYVTRPCVDALQRHFFARADAVSTVCDGIADLLQADYGLARRPAVIRSTPFYEQMPFRPCGKEIEIVYHGLVSPTRNLDVAVRALALCRPEFRLTVRGPVDPGYDAELMALARDLGVERRFLLAPPVPFADLVRSANEADIGYFVFANFSRQRQFTAPNKFFEYMMAGLALIVSDVPELSRIVRAHANGLLVGKFTPEAAASAINSLTRSEIDRMKRQSLAAAKELCWEYEQAKLIEAYGL